MLQGLSPFNLALNEIERRADQKPNTAVLRDTFVDSGVARLLHVADHQIIYGRRGTGKTHALHYLASEAQARHDIALYIDLRTVGDSDGLFDEETASLSERAAGLLVDMLGQVRDSIMNAVIYDDNLIKDATFTEKIDNLVAAITNVELSGDVELSTEIENKETKKRGISGALGFSSTPRAEIRATGEKSREGRGLVRETRRGAERIRLNFTDVSRALRELATSLSSQRVWLILDEWHSVPQQMQPYLAEFLVRCVLPLPGFTVKIAGIEHQCRFRAEIGDGHTIGFELGADIGANVHLDDFLVFNRKSKQAQSFFADLFYRHLTSKADIQERIPGLGEAKDVARIGFADVRAFDELVRSCEGVPRDAIYIAAKAAVLAGQKKISITNIREAASSCYQNGKAATLKTTPRADLLLQWVIDKVIHEKKARAFLVREEDSRDPLLSALFDARVLHIGRRGYSTRPQERLRFDIWVIDYGAYVDLIKTKDAPQGMLPIDNGDEMPHYVDTDVPALDLRAVRNAVLDLAEFREKERLG